MRATNTIMVQVVHGDPLLAAGLAATVHGQADMQLVGPGAEGNDRRCTTDLRRQADVLVADYETGLLHLAKARAGLLARHGALPAVLIVTHRDTESEIRHALEQGVRGFLVLGCGVDELVGAVRALRAGVRHIGGKAAQRLADSIACEALTGREQAVLRLLVKGLGNKSIANQLDIAIGTVKSHLKAIFQKLDAGSRTEVAAIAERRGLLTVDMGEPLRLGTYRNHQRTGAAMRDTVAH